MNVMKRVTNKIRKAPPGTVLIYSDFRPLAAESGQALAKALSRLAKSGEIKRLSKGKYYKPVQTRFGEAKPGESEIINSFLKIKGKRVAYKTGIALYNEMGLTTQIPNEVSLATFQGGAKQSTINTLRIRTVKSNVRPTEKNIRFLQLLDAIRDIKKIPGTSPDESVRRLTARVSELGESEINSIVALSQNYPPSTRALLGAMLDSLGINAASIRKTLNGTTVFKIGVSSESLPTRKKWKIV